MINVIDHIYRAVDDNQVLVGHELDLVVGPDQFWVLFQLGVLSVHVLVLYELLVVDQDLLVQLHRDRGDAHVWWVDFVERLELALDQKLSAVGLGQQVHHLLERTVLLRDLLPELRVIFCELHSCLLECDQVLAELAVRLYCRCVLKTLRDLVQKPVYQVIVEKTYLLPHYLWYYERALHPISQPVVLNATLE